MSRYRFFPSQYECSEPLAFLLPRLLYVLLLISILGGCQASIPLSTYYPLLGETFESRSQPVSLTRKSAEVLLDEGFIKIGYFNLRVLTKSCRRYLLVGKGQEYFCQGDVSSDPLSSILTSGAQVGGDVVSIEYEHTDTESMNLLGINAFYHSEYSSMSVAVWRRLRS